MRLPLCFLLAAVLAPTIFVVLAVLAIVDRVFAVEMWAWAVDFVLDAAAMADERDRP